MPEKRQFSGVSDRAIALTKIRRGINATRQETLESTRRIVSLFDECEDAGVHTLANLANQRAQLDRTENNLHDIQGSLKRAEETQIRMSNVEKCPCAISCCVLACNKKHKEKNSKVWKTKGKNTGKNQSKEKKLSSGSRKKTGMGVTFALDNDGANKNKNKPANAEIPILPPEESEKAIEENLGQASEAIRKLKNMALSTHEELTVGNEQLSRVNEKVALTNRRVSSMKTRSKKLLAMNPACCPLCVYCCNPFSSNQVKIATTLAKL